MKYLISLALGSVLAGSVLTLALLFTSHDRCTTDDYNIRVWNGCDN